jgi:hypothetical protein
MNDPQTTVPAESVGPSGGPAVGANG